MYLLLYGFWILLNGKLTAEVCLLGVGVVAAIGLLMFVLLGYTPRREWRFLKKVPVFILYVFVLIWEIIKANSAMLAIIVNEKRTVEPVLVTFKTDLKTKFGRFMLANSITLTPGTITVSMEGQTLTVHCISRSMLDTSPESVFTHWIKKLEA